MSYRDIETLYCPKCDQVNGCVCCPGCCGPNCICLAASEEVDPYELCDHCDEPLKFCICYPCDGCGYTLCDCQMDGWIAVCETCGWEQCACEHDIGSKPKCDECNHYTCSCVKCTECVSLCNEEGECPKCDSPSP